jgi:hypothetical protein
LVGESKARGLLRALVAEGSLPTPPEGPAGAAELLAAAREQRVSGVLLSTLERERPAWAGPLVEPLRLERRERLALVLRQIALAARAASLLSLAGIRALPLKGVVLAETVYDLESERPMGDVDLLVLERWDDATSALCAAGFAEQARADHARVLVEAGSGLVLELHRSVTSAPGLFPLASEGLWKRRRPGRGQLPLLPSGEDLLLQLALHAAFQHGLVLSLVQWLDFRRVLEREAIDAERLALVAAEARAAAPLAAALLAAEAVVAAPVSAAQHVSLEAALPAGLRRWLAPRLRDPLSLVAPSSPAVGRVRWELLAGRRAELLWRTLVLPEAKDGDTRLEPRLAQAAARLVRFGRAALASLTGLRRGD